MSLELQINEGIKAAMLTKDSMRLEALRGVKAAILLDKTKDGSASLAPDAEIKLLQRLVKQRRESAQIYEQNNRPELANKELQEAACIEAFLPKQMSAEEISVVVQSIIAQSNAMSAKDFGKVMGMAVKQLAGKADSKAVAEVIKALLPA
jgi:uncharacterized protein YqeY